MGEEAMRYNQSDRSTRRGGSALAWVLSVALAILVLYPLWLKAQHLTVPENPLQGRFVFEQKGCINCHAIQGDGGKAGPDLGRKKFYGSFLELASLMWNHIPEMLRLMRELGLPYPEFSQTELTELVTYLYYLRYLDEPGNLHRGKVLVEQKGCLDCHSMAGRGGRSAPDFAELASYVSSLYMAQALWNHSPEMTRELSQQGLQRPLFERGEMAHLSAYIRSAGRSAVRERAYMFPGNPKRGEQVIRQKGCLDCHSVVGAGTGIGPDLRDLEWALSVSEIAALMWNHGSSMERLMSERKIRWPRFDGREMADLISYLYFLGFQDRLGDPEAGQRLFQEKKCAQCHTPDARGIGEAPDLSGIKALSSPVAMARIMWNHAPAMEEKVIEKSIEWPKMTGQQMRDLHAYLLQSRTEE
jgi:cytochrome c551/c552